MHDGSLCCCRRSRRQPACSGATCCHQCTLTERHNIYCLPALPCPIPHPPGSLFRPGKAWGPSINASSRICIVMQHNEPNRSNTIGGQAAHDSCKAQHMVTSAGRSLQYHPWPGGCQNSSAQAGLTPRNKNKPLLVSQQWCLHATRGPAAHAMQQLSISRFQYPNVVSALWSDWQEGGHSLAEVAISIVLCICASPSGEWATLGVPWQPS